MKAVIALLLGALLAGCTDRVADAEAKREIVRKSDPTLAELCNANREVVAARLATHDAEGYRTEKAIAESSCLNAEILGDDQRASGEAMVADNMDAMAAEPTP